MAPRSSITKRWLLNSFGIIVVIMVAMVIGVSAAMHSFYYNSASQYIRTRAAAVSARLESAAADAGSDFNARLYELVQDFEYRDRIELMAIDSEGTVFLTSSGFVPQDTTMPDLAMARENGKSGSFTGRWEGQKIMAVTVLSSLSRFPQDVFIISGNGSRVKCQSACSTCASASFVMSQRKPRRASIAAMR